MTFYPAGGSGTGTQPWQFSVTTYGAKGDGKIGTGGTGTSGTNTFTDAGASFTAADAGKLIIINQGAGGSATNPFVGTIAAVNGPTSVRLSGNLAANAATAPYIYGTDDTAAINATVTAATAYAQANNFKAQITFSPLYYMVGGLTQQTTPVVYNSQIPIPVGTQFGRKLILDFVGVGDASEPDYWESTTPNLQGTCIVSARFVTGQPDGTFGSMSVMGSVTAITGLSPGNFANTLVNIQGVTIVVPWNSQAVGFDFLFQGQANCPNGSYLAFAPVNLSAATCGGPYLAATNIVPNGQSIGFRMPGIGNNDNCNIGAYTCEGANFGLIFSEHLTAQRLAIIYCNGGIQPLAGGNIHGGSILYYSTEANNVSLLSNASGGNLFPIFIGLMDSEVVNLFDIEDVGNVLQGYIGWTNLGSGAPTGVTGSAGLDFRNLRTPPGFWSGAPAAPTQAVAQQNTSGHTAHISVTSTAAISAIAVGPTSGTLNTITESAAIGVAAVVTVPSYQWYSVTSAGGTLTTKWVLGP